MNWESVILSIAPRAKKDVVSGLSAAMPGLIEKYALASTLRQAHFLGQCAHESAGFATTTEFASGRAYEDRIDLGNIRPGDGARFKGRGLIQCTGRYNYAHVSKALVVDFLSRPELLSTFPYAAEAAGVYWRDRGLNALADLDDVEGVTRRVNGGVNGLKERKAYTNSAKIALAKLAA
jgi:putative chitinase